MGGLKPSNLKDLKPYVEQIFAIALWKCDYQKQRSQRCDKRSLTEDSRIAQFQLEMNQLNSRPL
jgi:hypothetical protein